MPIVDCDKCNGKGTVSTNLPRKRAYVDPDTKQLVEEPVTFVSPCDKCNGTGQIRVQSQ